MILVSACLCNINCKYSGGNNKNEKVLELFKQGRVIPVCPEQLGGLETPRDCCEIHGGEGKDVLNNKAKVLTNKGADVSEKFKKGAYETLKIAKELEKSDVEYFILQSRSPSCGLGEIYDGNFNGEFKKGNGVAAQLLIDNGYKVIDVKDLK
ncbi:MAG: DUF523 domain-containing protein [Clostridiaceae bacterium]